MHRKDCSEGRLYFVFEKFHQDVAANPVVEGFPFGAPVAQLFVVGPKRRIVAGLHEFFSFGLAARADVDEKVVAGHGLPAFLRLFQVNGLGADDTRDGLVSDLDPTRRQDAVVNAADRVEAQKTVVFYVRHQKTHFVHMGGEHDVGTGKVRPLAGEQVAHRVDPHLVDEAADLLTDVSTYRGLVARHAAQRRQLR